MRTSSGVNTVYIIILFALLFISGKKFYHGYAIFAFFLTSVRQLLQEKVQQSGPVQLSVKLSLEHLTRT